MVLGVLAGGIGLPFAALLAGIGYASVKRGALFALLYSAPKLVFFDRYKPAVEHIAQSARVRS